MLPVLGLDNCIHFSTKHLTFVLFCQYNCQVFFQCSLRFGLIFRYWFTKQNILCQYLFFNILNTWPSRKLHLHPCMTTKVLSRQLVIKLTTDCHICVEPTLTSANAEDLSQYDPGYWTGRKALWYTTTSETQRMRVHRSALKWTLCPQLTLIIYLAQVQIWKH